MEVYEQSASSTPRATARPRVELAVGLASVRIRELPPRDHVGQGALSLFASAGYLWTSYLATQVEFTSQVEGFNWDYAHLRVARSGDVTNITLKHNYEASRRTVAQIVHVGPKGLFIRPYLGAGVGIESQTTYDTWYDSTKSVVLGPNDETVEEIPELPRTEADYVIVFGEAGLKMFLGRYAYLLIDWKFIKDAAPRGMFGVGVRLP